MIVSMDKRLIEELRQVLPGVEILTPDSPGYADHNVRWERRWMSKAGVIVLPTTADEVSKTLLFTQAHDIDFAVVCGGHGSRGCSTTKGGLLISMVKMNRISVNTSDNSVTIEGGVRWEEVYTTIEKFDLAIVGGGCKSVGVGGFGLGGGYGYLTGRHGLAIDNMLAAEVVLADGQVMKASTEENTDLFWALRGAGAAFGIVTSFKFQGYEQKNLCWYADLDLDLYIGKEALSVVIGIINKILLHSNGDSAMFMTWTSAGGEPRPLINLIAWHNGSEEAGRDFFAPLLALESSRSVVEMRPFSACGLQTPRTEPTARSTLIGGSQMAPVDVGFIYRLYDDFATLLEAGYTDSRIMWEFHNMNQVLKAPQMGTAFANRGAYGNVMFMPGWENREDDSVMIERALELATKCRTEFIKMKSLAKDLDDNTRTAVGLYTNYDGIGLSSKFLYGVNFDRLVKLKKFYDPDNVFWKFANFMPEEKYCHYSSLGV